MNIVKEAQDCTVRLLESLGYSDVVPHGQKHVIGYDERDGCLAVVKVAVTEDGLVGYFPRSEFERIASEVVMTYNRSGMTRMRADVAGFIVPTGSINRSLMRYKRNVLAFD